MTATLEINTTNIVELEYHTATDILIAEWPNVMESNFEAFKASLDVLLSFLRNNKVQNLLIDVRKSDVVIPSETYNDFLTWFILELTDTNLRKIVRLNPADHVRINVLDKTEIDVYKADYSVIFEEYTNYNEAYCWLSLSI